MSHSASGPLAGLRILEFASTEGSPGAFAATAFADLGADVLKLDRPADPGLGGPQHNTKYEPSLRGRPSVAIDLKQPAGVELALNLVAKADALIESFRPGIMEKIGLSPEVCQARNPRLVYGRMTGWGQTGPRANAAGHTIAFAAISGQLQAFVGQKETPRAPHNLMTDPSSVGMTFAFGVLSAIHEASRSGRGQVVDAGILDCTIWMLGTAFGRVNWMDEEYLARRYSLGTATHFHDVYQCADGRWIAVTALETRARTAFYKGLGIAPTVEEAEDHPAMRTKIASIVRQRTRDEWDAVFRGTDASVSPVLSLKEATKDPQNVARGNFIEVDGVVQPAPAPKFSRSVPALPSSPQAAGEGTEQGLRAWGVEADAIAALRAKRVIGRGDA